MRRTVFVTAILAVLATFAGPAFATTGPPVPVGAGRDAKGGVCVYGFSWVPFCVDPPAEIGAQVPPSPFWTYRQADGSVCAGYNTSRPVCTPPVPDVG